MKLTKQQKIEIAHKAHQARLELGLNEEQSLQSLNIELEHIENPELSEGRKK